MKEKTAFDNKLNKILSNFTFDDIDDDIFGDIFNEEQIKKILSYENTIPNAIEILPKDYIWYLKNYGSRTARNLEYQVKIDNNTYYIVAFEGLTEPANVIHLYNYHTCTGSYDYRLNEFKKDDYLLNNKFLPITSENQGKMLVMDFKDRIGSIWQFPSALDCKEHNLNYEPSFVATNFTEFLKLVQGAYSFKDVLLKKGFKETAKCSDVWKDNVLTENEVFYHVLNNFENKKKPNYIEFKDKEDFLNTLINQPEKVTINEPRAVELFHLSFNWKVKNESDFKKNIHKVQKLKSILDRKRENCKLTKLEQHINTGFSTIGTDHNFYKTILKSKMNGLECKETIILYKNPNTEKLSFVKRINIEKENLKVKGIGTFEFDYSWSSKRAKKTKWSKIPATIYLNQFEEDFNERYFSFIKQTINDISFKEKLEQFIFDYYQKYDYPEFVEMSEIDKDFFEEGYPEIKSSEKIWKLLGNEFDIHFIDDKRVDLQFEYLPDDEHGLNISFINDKLKITE